MRLPSILALGALLASCVAEPDYTGRVCTVESPCPSGFVCLDGRCAAAGLGPPPATDAGVPAVDAGERPPDAGPAPLDAGAAADAGPSVVRVTLSPGAATVTAGRSVRFTAEAEDSSGGRRDVSSEASWRATDPEIALCPDSACTAWAPGQVTVEAEFEGVVGQAALTVTPAVPVEVATFNKHNLVRLSDGRVFAWGWNQHRQVTDSGLDEIEEATQVPLTSVATIRAGGVHSVAVLSDGSVWAWGHNAGGQLGRGTVEDEDEGAPAPVVGLGGVGRLTGVDDVACGYDFCLALRAGEVVAWGANTFGSLGLGGPTDVATGTPVVVPGLTNVVEIAAGTYHAVARTVSGEVWTWGYDEYGQLGRGVVGQDANAPGPVVGIAGTGRLSNVVEVDAGWGHTMARTADGEILAWGWAAYRQLGPGATADTGTPRFVEDATQARLTGQVELGAGFAFGLSRAASGELLAWGSNTFGQLAAGGVAPTRATPAAVLGPSGGAPLAPASAFEAGGDHAIAIVGDRVYAWGSNVFGELGNGDSGAGERSARPVPVALPE